MGRAATRKVGLGPAPSAAERYLEWVDLAQVLPINVHLSSASEQTMVSLLGSPLLPLTTQDQPERASDLAKALKHTLDITPNLHVTGIGPALASLQVALDEVFAAEPDLKAVLDDSGMMSVRYRKPTDGSKSTKISNHSWGTAIDFRIAGHGPPGNTGGKIPRFIAVLLPVLNKHGWYSGIAFHDTMHFEVAEQTIREWARDGRLNPKAP